MRNRALTYTIAFAIVGIIIIVSVFYVERSTLETYEKNSPFISLGDKLKNRSLRAHLAMEEMFSGNASLNFERDVLALLNASQSILQGAYNGDETELGTFAKPGDEETRVILKEAMVDLEKVIALSQERYKAYKRASGDELSYDNFQDKPFNAAFDRYTITLDRLIDRVHSDVQSDHRMLSYLGWASIALVVVVFGIWGLIFFRLQNSSEKLVIENRERIERQEQAVSSVSSFIEGISAGNYLMDLHMEGDENLKNTLINMRDKLRENAEDERRRSWSTTGMAQIGEILRTSTSSKEELFDSIIKFVVKYTNSNQGGLFLLNEEEAEGQRYLELVACYAFERKKYLTRKINVGEGLVGQCYLEGERIFLLEVPPEYITITSGLGGANPNALLIIPLKVNEKIYGVLELATFGKYEEYQIELVEKLGESIASTISNVRVNESTRVLLQTTQEQAEEMRAQEEEMRQNMEELEATQEQMHRQMKELNILKDSLEKERYLFGALMDTIPDSIYFKDKDSKFIRISKHLADHLNTSPENMIGKSDFDFMDESHANRAFADEQSIISTRRPMVDYLEKEVKEDGSVHWLSSTKMPLLNLQGEVVGTFGISRDVTKLHSLVNDLSVAQETMQAIIDNLPRAVFWKDRELRIQGCNKIFAGVAGFNSPKEMIGKTDFEMPWRQHAEAYRADDLSVMNNNQPRIDMEERNVNSEGVESWVLTSKVPITNEEGEVVAVLGMFEDITERKVKEQEIDAKLKELEMLKQQTDNQKTKKQQA